MANRTSPTDGLLYRRVAPSHWEGAEAGPAAFVPNGGLSVFHSGAVASPRYVLQCRIESLNQDLLHGTPEQRERAQKALDKTPDVDAMIKAGWGLVSLKVQEVLALGFTLSAVDAKGHLDIVGFKDQFKQHSLTFQKMGKRVEL